MTLSSISSGFRSSHAINSGYKQNSNQFNHVNSKKDIAIISESARELAAQKNGTTSREERSESPFVEAKEQASGLK